MVTKTGCPVCAALDTDETDWADGGALEGDGEDCLLSSLLWSASHPMKANAASTTTAVLLVRFLGGEAADGAWAIGRPHFRHESAASLTSELQSGHLTKAMLVSPIPWQSLPIRPALGKL